MAFRRCVLIAGVVLLATLRNSPLSVGQAPESPPKEAPPTVASQPSPREVIAAKRAELTKELAAAKRNKENAAAQEGVTPPEHLAKEVELLERIDLALVQQESQLQHGDELRASRGQIESDLADLRKAGPSEKRPDSFLLLESVRNELNAHTAREEKNAAIRQAIQKNLEAAKQNLETREPQRRKAKEAFDTNTDESAAPGLAIALRLAELESRVAAETVALHELELKNQVPADEAYDLRLTFLMEKVGWIEKRARFAQEDLDEQLDRVTATEFELKRKLDTAKVDLDISARRLADVRQRRDRVTEPDQILVEEVEAARLAREACQQEVTLLSERLQRLLVEKSLWNDRYQTINQLATTEELSARQEEAKKTLGELNLSDRLQMDDVSQLRKALVTLQEKSDSSKETNPEAGKWVRRQIQQVQKQIALYDESIAGIETTRRLCKKLLTEIEAEATTVTWDERLQSVWETALAIWNYELTSVEDRPITVGKILLGIILIFVGLYVSRRVSAILGRRLFTRLGMNEGASAAIQTLVFYLFLLTFGFFALRIVNVPLTAFTVVGGAVAIGVGFGSQSVINNFISGLILLIERPVRVGDLIHVDELYGIVEHIGPRSTRVRSSENVDIIVPNSSFLEKNVINWTLTDDRYRAQVAVGVIYGSPTRDVARLIRQSVDEHAKVLPKPEPIVLFTDFGDNSLNFEAHFWIRMKRLMDRRIIESEVRYRIDDLFREAGIVIAFPQRDVHLDSVRPVEVRLVSNEPAGGEITPVAPEPPKKGGAA